MHFLGVDVGTSALKAVLVDARQGVVAEAAVPLRTAQPRPGWSEQDPRDWWQALLGAVKIIGEARPEALRSVRALGLSGQMHAAVLLDGTGAVIRPAILWNDGRAADECVELEARVAQLTRIAGVAAMPGFTAPKLMWIARHEPRCFERAAKIVSAKDYLRFRLTGEVATDMSDAAGTLWLDEAARDWSDPILAASGMSRSQMPKLFEGSEPTGDVAAEHLRAWGVDGPVIVAAGAGDAAAAGIGIGAIHDGDAFISLGTSAQLFVTDERYRAQADRTLHAFAHGLPSRWFRMAAMLNGATCLEWAARLIAQPDIGALLERTEAQFAGPSRILFLPYLSGERTPHADPAARGVYFGLDAATGPIDLVQATLEGVAFSLLDARLLLEASSVRFGAIAAVGGGARSRFWMQILSHVLGRPIVRYRGGEKGPAFGAARLARLALAGEAPGDVCSPPAVLDVLEPDPALQAAYARRFERFASLYRVLKSEFRAARQG